MKLWLYCLISTLFVSLLAHGCGKSGSQGLPGDKGDTGEDGASIQGPQGFPGPECAFFCHGKHKFYVRCDGHADVELTGVNCVGEGEDDK